MFSRSSTLTCLSVALALLSGVLWTGSVAAQDVVYVEEDWVVEITEPDPASHAPQIITAMSSTNRLEDVHAIFEINHATLPDYQAGGMSLQIWSSDTNLEYMVHPYKGTLYNNNEVITYTMTMRIGDGRIRFEVKDGESTTWGGNWGIGGFYRTVPTAQSSLPYYSPETSVKFSKVGFAKHRVRKFALKESRTYDAAGNLISRDTTERIVHQLTPEG